MGKITEKLKSFPNEPFQFDHNGQIKDFFVERGLSSQFKLNVKGPNEEKEMVQAVTEMNHPTHYILITLYIGYDDPNENGYYVVCLPKSKCSYENFMQMSGKILNANDDRIVGGGMFFGQDAFPTN